MNQASSKKMSPHPVHRRLGEKGILRSGQPIGQMPARIARFGLREFGPLRWSRGHRYSAHRVFHLASRREIKSLGAGGNRRGQTRPLLLHRAEVSSQLVEIILTPFFIRMVVTLGALQPGPQEQLAELCGQFRRIPTVAINHRRTCPVVRPFSHQNISNKLIIRPIGPERFAQPLIEQEHALHPHPIRIGPQEVSPLVGPVIGIGRMLQNRVNEPLTLVRRRIRQERTHLFRRG